MSLGTDTVIDREVEWLSTTDDDLPALVKTDALSPDAPFDFIQAYWPRPTDTNCGVYVMRSSFQIIPWSTGRELSRHTMRLRVWWPINGEWQDSQRSLDAAVDLLVQRIAGPQFHKNHGNRFMSAGEVRNSGNGIGVTFPADPERSDGNFRVDVTYVIDDTELSL